MPISCDANSLSAAAKCYCFDDTIQQAVQIYLLEQIAQTGLTPSQLQAAAKCYCFDEDTQRAIKAYLLCQISNAA